MSNAITSVMLPEGVPYKELYNKIKEKGFIIYGAKPPFEGKMFQVANMGDLKDEDIKNFLEVLEQAAKEIQNASKT